MNRSFTLPSLSFLLLLLLGGSSLIASADPGRAVIGQVRCTALYATNVPEEDGQITALSTSFKDAVQQKNIAYDLYYQLGQETGDLYRSYINWLKPIQGSDRFMLSYEPQGALNQKDGGLHIQVSFWQNKQKAFSTKTLKISPDSPIVIVGPNWRNGKIIFILELSQ